MSCQKPEAEELCRALSAALLLVWQMTSSSFHHCVLFSLWALFKYLRRVKNLARATLVRGLQEIPAIRQSCARLPSHRNYSSPEKRMFQLCNSFTRIQVAIVHHRVSGYCGDMTENRLPPRSRPSHFSKCASRYFDWSFCLHFTLIPNTNLLQNYR
jgi:hypothetical protein